jgi:hypothetical protein
MRFLQLGIVAGRPTGQHYAARRTYSFADLLAFEVGRVLVCAFNIPTAVALRIVDAQRRHGYFLAPAAAREIARLKKKIDHPAELREILNARFGLKLLEYKSPNRLAVKDDGSRLPVPRSRETLKKEVLQIAMKATKFFENGNRPWPVCLLVRKTANDWQDAIVDLPSVLRGTRNPGSDDINNQAQELFTYASRTARYTGTQVINLFKLETELRKRLARYLDGLLPEEGEHADEAIDVW